MNENANAKAIDRSAPFRCQPALCADRGKRSHRSDPDFDGNGNLNCNDFMAFLNSYAAQEKRADFNRDGQLNAKDFVAFRKAFERATRHPEPPSLQPAAPLSVDAEDPALLDISLKGKEAIAGEKQGEDTGEEKPEDKVETDSAKQK